MAAGGILVAGLVVWALTRSVQPPLISPIESQTTGSVTATTATTATATTVPTATTTAAPLSPSSFSIPATGTPQAPDKVEVARISAEDLHAGFTRGDVTILDVRDAAAFATGHIPGSLNMPMASIQGQLDVLPKGKPIVAYCT